VTAFSVDNEVGSIAKHKLRFPIGHGADACKISAATGAYTNDKPHYPQATGFLLAPDGLILNAVYSQLANRPSGS
jgi:hypothetical protein